MGILNDEINGPHDLDEIPLHLDERYKRDVTRDIKDGIDMLFEFKRTIDKFHPTATDILIRMITM